MASLFGFEVPDSLIKAGGAALGGYLGSKGTPDQKTTEAPYMHPGQQEGITNFLNASKQQYLEGPQKYFPGQTVAELDPSYIAGQNMRLGTTNQQQGLVNNMVQGVQGQLQGADQVGGFQLQDQIGFGIDPRLQSAVANPIMRNLQERMLPGLDLQATQQGAFGGSRAQQMKGQAVSDSVGKMSESIARANLDARGQSINQRTGDINAQINARNQDINQNQYNNNVKQWGINAIPGAISALGSPGQSVQNIGRERTDYEQRLIGADKNRFDFNQTAPIDSLTRLGNRVNQAPGGVNRTVQGQEGNLTNILGGAFSGYNTANDLVTPAPGGAATQPLPINMNPTGGGVPQLNDPNFQVPYNPGGGAPQLNDPNFTVPYSPAGKVAPQLGDSSFQVQYNNQYNPYGG